MEVDKTQSNLNRELFNVTKSLDLANIITSNKYVILKFSASWCGPCQNKDFKSRYELFKSNKRNIIFFEFDIDDDKEIIDCKEYYDFNIKSIPHFKMCYNGSVVREYNGTNLQQMDEDLNKLMVM
jgi:thiol-disulfide isomerase/thioredoxin